MPGPWSTTSGPWSTTEGPSTGSTGVRGDFMGVTGPGGTVSTSYLNKIDLLLHGTGWVRAGYPEISDGSFTGSALSTAFLNTVIAECDRVHSHGYGYHFGILGVPTSVNPAAGTNGNWKYFPLDATGDSFMATCAVQIATVLAARAVANGLPVALEYLQEPNIRSFNPGAQSARRWARSSKAIRDAVNSAEPSVILVLGSVANRGDYRNPAPSDIGWTGDQFINTAINDQPTIITTSAFDFAGYHPYVYPSSALANVGWGVPQMDAFADVLKFANAKNRSGTPLKVAVTEYGTPYTPAPYDNAIQLQAVKNYITALKLRRTPSGYLGGMEEYYEDIPDEKSLIQGSSLNAAGVEFARVTLEGSGPHAAFAFVANGLAVTFTDMSTGATGWSWDFGDTATSSSQNPTHTYATADTFTVTLTADDGTNSDTVTHDITVSPSGVAPTLNYGPASGPVPLLILASDTTPGSTARVWDFGDGTPQATSKDTAHTYATAGTYTLALFVTVGGATAATTRTITVTSAAGVPNASFLMTPGGGIAPLAVSFTDLSTNGPTSWAWDFGDGNISAAQNPTHIYTNPGVYTVTLFATNANGEGSTSQLLAVGVDPATDGLQVTIEIGSPPNPRTNASTWVIEDPVRGKIDDAYVIAEQFDWIEVTADLVSIDTDRQFNPTTNRMDPGTSTIVLHNDNPGTAAWYDPQNWASPFFPTFGPACRIRITVDGSYIYGGIIDDAPIADEVGNIVTVTLHATDILSELTEDQSYRPEAVHNAGQRIHRWLEMASSTEAEYLAPGFSQYQAGIRQEQSALTAIGDVVFADGGMFYATSQGNAYVYIDRDSLMSATYNVTFTDAVPTGGTTLQYVDVVRNTGRDLIRNEASFAPIGNTDETQVVSAHDPESVGLYKSRTFDQFASPQGGASPTEAAFRMQYRVNQLVADYKDPHPRFESIEVDGMRYTPAQRRFYLAGLELGQIVRVIRSAPGATPPTDTRLQVIVGLSHHVEPGVLTTTITMLAQLEAP